MPRRKHTFACSFGSRTHALAYGDVVPDFIGTLSGGEVQRIRLSTQIGSGLMGMLYVLDEPSIGLHPKDNVKMLCRCNVTVTKLRSPR